MFPSLLTKLRDIALIIYMQVISEGVETEERADLLRAAGRHELQGYVFGRPMSLAALRALCRAHASEVRELRTG